MLVYVLFRQESKKTVNDKETTACKLNLYKFYILFEIFLFLFKNDFLWFYSRKNLSILYVCTFLYIYLSVYLKSWLDALLSYYTAKYGHKSLFLARKTTYLTLRHLDTCCTATDNFAAVDSRLYEQYVNFT